MTRRRWVGGPTNDFDQNVALRRTQRCGTLPSLNDPSVVLYTCRTERCHSCVFCPSDFLHVCGRLQTQTLLMLTHARQKAATSDGGSRQQHKTTHKHKPFFFLSFGTLKQGRKSFTGPFFYENLSRSHGQRGVNAPRNSFVLD